MNIEFERERPMAEAFDHTTNAKQVRQKRSTTMLHDSAGMTKHKRKMKAPRIEMKSCTARERINHNAIFDLL